MNTPKEKMKTCEEEGLLSLLFVGGWLCGHVLPSDPMTALNC